VIYSNLKNLIAYVKNKHGVCFWCCEFAGSPFGLFGKDELNKHSLFVVIKEADMSTKRNLSLLFISLFVLFSFAACNTNGSVQSESKESEKLNEFMELCFTCPNQDIVNAIASSDGGYITEGSRVEGSGDTVEDHLINVLNDYVEEDYVQTLAHNYVGVNHLTASENGSSASVESLEIETSEEQYGFTLHLTCKSRDGEKTPISLQGTICLSSTGKVEMLKINSGFDQYLKMLES